MKVMLTDDLLQSALRVDGARAPLELREAISVALRQAAPRRRWAAAPLPRPLSPAWLALLLALLLATIGMVVAGSRLIDDGRIDTTELTPRVVDAAWASRPLEPWVGTKLTTDPGTHFVGAYRGQPYLIDRGRIMSYDVSRDAWIHHADVALAELAGRFDGKAIGADGAIYLFGAEAALARRGERSIKISFEHHPVGAPSAATVEELSLWQPDAVGDHVHATSVVGPDGRIYLYPYSEAAKTANRMDIYDPARDSWSVSAVMPRPVRGPFGPPAVVTADGQIGLFAHYFDDESSTSEWEVHLYDPAADAWSWRALELPEGAGTSFAVGPDGAVYTPDTSLLAASLYRIELEQDVPRASAPPLQASQIGRLPGQQTESVTVGYSTGAHLVFIGARSLLRPDGPDTYVDAGSVLIPLIVSPATEE
jgi:hypothetical protein